jgi:hypothetical protein
LDRSEVCTGRRSSHSSLSTRRSHGTSRLPVGISPCTDGGCPITFCDWVSPDCLIRILALRPRSWRYCLSLAPSRRKYKLCSFRQQYKVNLN